MGAPYQPHSDTSRAAAESVEPKLPKQQAELLAWFRGNTRSVDGATDDDIAQAIAHGFLSLSLNGARARRIELVKRGLVKDSGRTRLTRSDRLATVWVIA